MAKKTKTRTKFASEAALQSLVRYGPQATALQQLGEEAASAYKATVNSADASAGATQAAVASARPEVERIYGDAGLAGLKAGTLANTHLQGLQGGGEGLQAIKAGAVNESRAMAGALTQQRAAALTDLKSRGVRAREGAQYAHENARSALITALSKIGQQQVALTGEKGAFEASVIQGLQEAQDQRDFTAGENDANRANARLTAGVDAQGQVIPGGKADKPGKKGPARLPGGAKLRTTEAHAALINKVQAASGLAKEYLAANPKATRHEVAMALMAGDPGGTIHETDGPNKGKVALNPDGTEKKAPAIKPQEEFLTSLALDLVMDGHISRANVVGDRARQWAGLHQRGYSVKDLGLPGPPSAKEQDRNRKNAKIADAGVDEVARLLASIFGKG